MAKFYFGQFQYAQSFFHRLNPTLKIIIVFLFCDSTFLFNSLYAYMVFLAFVILLVLFSKVFI